MLRLRPIHLFILSAVGFLILFFGLSKVSPEILHPEKSGLNRKIENNVDQESIKWKDSLNANDRATIELLDQQYNTATNDSIKLMRLEQISSFWYKIGKVDIAAGYASKIAQIYPTAERWALAATNYVLAAKQPNASPENQTDWISLAKAEFDEAIKIEPNEISHKLNRALLNVEFPSQDGPMQGILAIRKLGEENPDNTLIMFHLARLSIMSGQWDKAKERLSQLILKDPNYSRAYCLLLQVAQHDHNDADVKKWSAKCNNE